MRSCESHCATCGQHFVTDEAFDAHRRFEPGHQDDWDHRICVEAADDKAFALADGDGVCDLIGGTTRLHVQVWSRARVKDEKREAA